jgi:hypothetical protein
VAPRAREATARRRLSWPSLMYEAVASAWLIPKCMAAYVPAACPGGKRTRLADRAAVEKRKPCGSAVFLRQRVRFRLASVTEDWQDPVTSRARQLQQAAMLTAGHGVLVAGFFDCGESRTLPWPRRPQAAALVAQLADPERGWDAIVIGEYERAFYGSQYASMAPLFEHYGIGLWMPEVGGRVDWHAEDHEQMVNGRHTFALGAIGAAGASV